MVDKEPFERAVDRVSTLSSERGRAIKLSIADGKMTLSVNNPDSARRARKSRSTTTRRRSTSASTPATCSTSLGQLAGDTALIRMADPGSPTLIQDRDGANALYVLMPLRV